MARKRISDSPTARETRVDDSRSLEVRDMDEREALSDDIESPLYIPKSEWPEGKTLRWISVEVQGAFDKNNWTKRARAGWTPAPAEMFAHRFPSVGLPGQPDANDGTINYGGLLLCMRDERLTERDKRRQEQDTIDANRSVETFVEQGSSMFPRFKSEDRGVRYERASAQFKE